MKSSSKLGVIAVFFREFFYFCPELRFSAASANLNQTSFIKRFYDLPAPQSQLEILSGIHKGSILPAASILLFLKMSLGQLLKQLN